MIAIAPVAEQDPQRVRCSRIVSFAYGTPSASAARVEPRGGLGARRAPVPALDRGALLRAGCGHEQQVAAAMRARAPRLLDEPAVVAEERDRAGRARDRASRGVHLGQAAIDPGAQL